MMNGLRTWVLHDLPHVLPSRSVQASPANHVHTSTAKRRFWNLFDFGRKPDAAKKCPPPKNTARASMEADPLAIIPAARRNLHKAKSMTRLEMQKQAPKTKLFASPNMIVNVTSFTKKEDYTSLLDGNPVPMNMKLKLKGYRTLRTQKCEDFAFVPGGNPCELDIIPPRAFDGWKARENGDASKSVTKLSVAEASVEKPSTNSSSLPPTGTSETSKNAASVDVPSHPPTFESISAAAEEVKAAAQEQNPLNSKSGPNEMGSANNSSPEPVPKPKVECETNSAMSSAPKAKPEAELSTAPNSGRIEATSDKNKPTLDCQPQPSPESSAKSPAETSEKAPVKKNVAENFLKMSMKPPKSPTDSRGGSSSLNKLGLGTQALGGGKQKKYDVSLAEVAGARELGIGELQSLMTLKNDSAASVPYFAPIPRRKTSVAITHSQLIIHDHQPSTKYSYSSAPSYASPAKSAAENMTFAPPKKMSDIPSKTKTACFSSVGGSNASTNMPFNSGGASNAGGFGNNGNRRQSLCPPSMPKRPSSTKQHNPERLQQAVRMKSTDSAGVLKRVENSGSSTLTGNAKDSRMPSFKSWQESGTQIQAQSYSCRRNRCNRDNDNQRKCKRRERRKCCEEEEEEQEMIPAREICTKVREEKKEKRPRCKRQQQRSCERSCERAQPKQKKCKRYCCPALRRRPDCNFEKERCPKEEKQMQTCGQRDRKCGYGGVPRVPVKRTKPDKTCMEDKKSRQRRSCDRREQSCGRRRRECRRECDRDDSCGRRSRTGGRGCNRRMSSLAGSQASLCARNDYFEPTNGKMNRTFSDIRHGMNENLRPDQSAAPSQPRARQRVDLEHGKSVSSYSVRRKSGGCTVAHDRFPSNVILNRTYSQLKSANNMRPLPVISLVRPYSQLANDKSALLGRTRPQLRQKSVERTFVKSARDSETKESHASIGGKRSYGTESDDDNVKFFMKSRAKPPPNCKQEDSGSDRCAKRKKAGSKCENLKGKCGGDTGKGDGGKCEKLKGSCGKQQTGSKCKGGQSSKSDSFCAGKKGKGEGESSEQRMKREREEIKECKKQLKKSDSGSGKCGKSSKTKFEAVGVDSLIGDRFKKCLRSANLLSIRIPTTGRLEAKGLDFLNVDRSFSTTRSSCGKDFPIRADNRDYDVEELPILVEVEPSEVTEDPPQSKKKPVKCKKH